MIINAINHNQKLYLLWTDVVYGIKNESELAAGVTVMVEASNSAPDPQHYIESGCQALEPIVRAKFIHALQIAIRVDKSSVVDVSNSIAELWQGGVFDFPAAAAPVAVAPVAAAPAAPAVVANSSDATRSLPWNDTKELLAEIKANATSYRRSRDRRFLAKLNQLRTLTRADLDVFTTGLNEAGRIRIEEEWRLARERARDYGRRHQSESGSEETAELTEYFKPWKDSAQKLLKDLPEKNQHLISDRMRHSFPKIPKRDLEIFIANLPVDAQTKILQGHERLQKRVAKTRSREQEELAKAQQQMPGPVGTAAFPASISSAPAPAPALYPRNFLFFSGGEEQQRVDAQSTQSLNGSISF